MGERNGATTFSITTLSIINGTFSVLIHRIGALKAYAVPHYAECHYTQCHYSECHYAVHCYAECGHVKCRVAKQMRVSLAK